MRGHESLHSTRSSTWKWRCAFIRLPESPSAVAAAAATFLSVSNEVTSAVVCAGQSGRRSVPRFAENRPAILNRSDISLFSPLGRRKACPPTSSNGRSFSPIEVGVLWRRLVPSTSISTYRQTSLSTLSAGCVETCQGNCDRCFQSRSQRTSASLRRRRNQCHSGTVHCSP